MDTYSPYPNVIAFILTTIRDVYASVFHTCTLKNISILRMDNAVIHSIVKALKIIWWFIPNQQ